MRITDPTGMDWYEDEDGNAMWRRSQDEEYTDDDGRVWKNIGTEYLHVRGNRATLFSQGTNDEGELTLQTSVYEINNEGESQKDADREAVLGWLSTDASRAAAKEWGRDSSLTNWIKFCVTEVLGQYTDPMRVVNGLSVGVAGYSGNLRGITAHGVERIAGTAATRGGVLSMEGVNVTKSLGRVFVQADGAKVFLHEITLGRFNAVVEGNRGIITTMSNWSQKSINRIANNYGWNIK